MTRTVPFLAALGMAAVLAVAASSATRPPITQASSGKTFHLAKGASMTIRLSNRWRWSDPHASSNAVELTPVQYFVDPGFSEWTVDGLHAGRATISAVGHASGNVTRNFHVTIAVGQS